MELGNYKVFNPSIELVFLENTNTGRPLVFWDKNNGPHPQWLHWDWVITTPPDIFLVSEVSWCWWSWQLLNGEEKKAEGSWWRIVGQMVRGPVEVGSVTTPRSPSRMCLYVWHRFLGYREKPALWQMNRTTGQHFPLRSCQSVYDLTILYRPPVCSM